eukprot:6309197-Alexandrium_andersonii.AAC.1
MPPSPRREHARARTNHDHRSWQACLGTWSAVAAFLVAECCSVDVLLCVIALAMVGCCQEGLQCW